MIWAVTPIPLINCVFFSRDKLILPKPSFDQFAYSLHGFGGVFSLGLHGYMVPLGRGKHHQVQDALAVSHLAIFFYFDVRAETAGGLYKRGRGPGVEAKLILDHENFGYQGLFIWTGGNNWSGNPPAPLLNP
jgi:hypothetical protein